MYSKFENFMKKYLAPLADKMDKEVHLSAVKKAVSYTHLTLPTKA